MPRWLRVLGDYFLRPPAATRARVFYSPTLAKKPPSPRAVTALQQELDRAGFTRMVPALNTACLGCGKDDGNTVMVEVLPSEWEWRHRGRCT